MSDLEGKVALITGASAPQGIGSACAHKLGALGARVVVTDLPRQAEALNDVADLITAQGGTTMALPLDVTQSAEIATCLSEVQSRFGPVDILVNNAGSLAGSADFMTTTPLQWQSSFEVNLLGPMMLSQAVIPHMHRKGDGRIINIGSTGSLGAEPGFGAYTAMKHALVGFTKTLAAEFGPAGILCNCVCPGYIATDMHMAANHRLAGEAGVSLEQIKAQRYANVALRDAGLPQDVAEAVAYLAGPQSRYVTGITLPVTGGVPPGI